MRRIIFLLVLVIAAAVWAEDNVIDRVVAVVDNEIILASELEQYLQFNVGSQQQLAAMRESQRDSLRSMILEELIRQKILLAKARADTLVVDSKQVDGELDNRMKTLIQNAGGQDKLEEYYGMPLTKIKRQFRPLVEENMLIDQVRTKKLESVRVGPAEVQRFWQTFKDSIPPLKDAVCIAHILLQDTLSDQSKQAALHTADSLRQLIVDKKATLEELAKKFSVDPGSADKGGSLGITNRGDLVPEYESAAYLLKVGEISQPVVSVFGVHIIRLDSRLGEKISTSHILLKIVPSDDDRARTQAKADSILKQLKAGADFADLAKTYSTDTKTALRGGDLGCFAPEELPDDFRAPIKNLKKDEVAAPVRTRFGLHLIKVTDREEARSISLAQDFDRIANMAMAKKRQEAFSKWIAELSAQTYIERKDVIEKKKIEVKN